MPMTGLAMFVRLIADAVSACAVGVSVFGDAGELVPVEAPVEPHAQPATRTHVRRDEELVGVRLDQHLLHPLRRGAPDRETAVAVVVVHHHQERTLLADEEGRRAVARPLAGLRQTQADVAKPVEDLFVALSDSGNLRSAVTARSRS